MLLKDVLKLNLTLKTLIDVIEAIKYMFSFRWIIHIIHLVQKFLFPLTPATRDAIINIVVAYIEMPITNKRICKDCDQFDT